MAFLKRREKNPLAAVAKMQHIICIVSPPPLIFFYFISLPDPKEKESISTLPFSHCLQCCLGCWLPYVTQQPLVAMRCAMQPTVLAC